MKVKDAVYETNDSILRVNKCHYYQKAKIHRGCEMEFVVFTVASAAFTTLNAPHESETHLFFLALLACTYLHLHCRGGSVMINQ